MLSSWRDVARQTGSSWQPFEFEKVVKTKQEVNFQFKNFTGRSKSVCVEERRVELLEFGLRC